MSFFKYLFDRIKENPHIVFFYIVISLLSYYLLKNIFGIDLNSITKDNFKDYVFSYKYYSLLALSFTINAFFSAGIWYSAAFEKELSFEDYFKKCFYFFKRFLVFGFLGFVILMFLLFPMFLESRIALLFYALIVMFVLFYFGIKLSLAPAYVVYLDLGVLESFKRSYFSVKGVYFWIIVFASLIKNFLSKNVILSSFFEVCMILLYCYLFVKIKLEEDKKEEEVILS
ncbi:MAG: hypothetical protein ACP5SD_04415 [Elusimicrobiales bacterium]